MKCSFSLTLSLAMFSGAVPAQGLLNFSNYGDGVLSPVSDWDGTRQLFGPTFAVDLFWTLGVVTDSNLLASLGQPAAFDTNGYFFGGIRTIPNAVAGAAITCQVRVWDTPDGNVWSQPLPSYSPSARIGASLLFQLFLADSTNAAPSLVGLMPFHTTPLVSPLRPQRVPLAVTETTSTLVFSWPSYWKGWTFALQENADLSTTNWLTLTNSPQLTGSRSQVLYQITIGKPSPARFYRLVQ